MASCIDCGRECRGARCKTHQVEHCAATDHNAGPCPECGTETIPRGVRCGDCIGGDQ